MSKKLEEYTKEELLKYVRQLRKDTRFGLVWNPKEEQVALDCETKLPVLQEVKDRVIAKAGDNEPTHILIEGDNYHSLSVLNYTHAGKIDFIYIDPPYNTGNKDFIYNDHYVDKEDPYRHSEWLSFMDNRLRLAKSLLADTGVIFISIDDNEYAHLKILCDSIFGEESFINNFMWLHGKGKKNKQSRTLQQYTLAYGRVSRDNLPPWNMTKAAKGTFSNPDNDPRGEWFSGSISFSEQRSNKNSDKYFEIVSPSGVVWKRQWMCTREEMDDYLAENKIYFGSAPEYSNTPRIKIFPSDTNELIPDNILDNCGTTRGAQKELDKMLGMRINDKGKKVSKFENPKPHELIEHLIKISTDNPDAIILDFFAGSGTTGEAVLRLNAEDGGKRQFILGTDKGKADEGGVNIAEEITYERITKVIEGYSGTKPIPANLRYFRTEFVDTNGLSKLTDSDRLEIAKEMGTMIALRENSFKQTEQTDHWQTYESSTQVTAIYYREDKTKINEYIEKLNAQNKPVKLYVFGWNKNTATEYASKKISVEDIPDPLIEVYKEIAR